MERIILQDKKLMDLDLLSSLLGNGIVDRIHLTYLSREAITESNINIKPDIPVIVIDAYESDLDTLDNYLDCPFNIRRTLTIVDGSIYWVYMEKR